LAHAAAPVAFIDAPPAPGAKLVGFNAEMKQSRVGFVEMAANSVRKSDPDTVEPLTEMPEELLLKP
jgi:hypothetical protein